LDFLLAFSLLPLFPLAAAAAVILLKDWRFALPMWLLTLADRLFLLPIALAFFREDRAAVSLGNAARTIECLLIVASALTATIAGYWPDNPSKPS
jgi:hypothetical protein